jgi:hypothetical protein
VKTIKVPLEPFFFAPDNRAGARYTLQQDSSQDPSMPYTLLKKILKKVLTLFTTSSKI